MHKKKESLSQQTLFPYYLCITYFLLQAFSQVVLEHTFVQESAFSQAALGHAFVQESAFSQVVQSILHESATQQDFAAQQESAATHSVLAFSQVSFALLLQHELMVRAATATITNNTFFISFLFNGLTIF